MMFNIKRKPVFTIILLNWNRFHLLRTTVYSILINTKSRYKLIIIDNNSSDDSQPWIKHIVSQHQNLECILLSENHGGEAFNMALEKAEGEYVLFAENDLEFLPAWDTIALAKFNIFPELGQLSVFSPFPQVDKGEIWEVKPVEVAGRNKQKLYWALQNVGTTSIIRWKLIEAGVSWHNIRGEKFLFPDDGRFSLDIKNLGYRVAWSDKYMVFNWGHNISEMRQNLNYYLQNYSDKDHLKIEGLENRLNKNGYVFSKKDGEIIDIVKV